MHPTPLNKKNKSYKNVFKLISLHINYIPKFRIISNGLSTLVALAGLILIERLISALICVLKMIKLKQLVDW